MLITKEALKTLINGLVAKMQNYRGNWNQNDPTASDYIKNRPFYTEKNAKKIILPETFVESFEGGFTLTEPLIEGNTYTVLWNGTEYPCVAKNYDGYIMIGNNSIYEYDDGITMDTGEPFAMEAQEGRNNLYVYIGENLTNVTFSIYTISDVIRPIDKIFLPSMDFVSYTEAQNLTSSQQAIAKENIGVFEFSGDYNDLSNKPTLFSGQYADLTGKPTIPDVLGKMDKTNPVGNGHLSINRHAYSEIGEASTTFGKNNIASGAYSCAEGDQTIATGEGSHSEGYGYIGSFTASHRDGTTYAVTGSMDVVAVGRIVIYEVAGTIDSAIITAVNNTLNLVTLDKEFSFSGMKVVNVYARGSAGKYSHTEGMNTGAGSECQHVQGKYNIYDDANKYAHIVGNGTNAAPSNAHTLDWNGNAWFAGNVYVGGTSQEDGATMLLGLPTVTASDNGKFLRVVDGLWAAASIPNAEEASF